MREGKAVVGWMRVGEAGVQKKQQQVLCFVVPPGCFCLRFCLTVLFVLNLRTEFPLHNPNWQVNYFFSNVNSIQLM